jgi:hypothetical protein
MGWRLLKWLWREPPIPFRPADRGSNVFVIVFDDTIKVPESMSQVYVPTLRAKDPDDIDSGTFDFSARLRKHGTEIATAAVVVVSGPDSLLVVSDVAHQNGVVSYLRSGGTITTTQLYLLRCRVTTTSGLQFDQSAWLPIAER